MRLIIDTFLFKKRIMRHKYDYVSKVGVILFLFGNDLFLIVIMLSHNIYYGTF